MRRTALQNLVSFQGPRLTGGENPVGRTNFSFSPIRSRERKCGEPARASDKQVLLGEIGKHAECCQGGDGGIGKDHLHRSSLCGKTMERLVCKDRGKILRFARITRRIFFRSFPGPSSLPIPTIRKQVDPPRVKPEAVFPPPESVFFLLFWHRPCALSPNPVSPGKICRPESRAV